jgi:hypothetical protein
MLSTVLFAVPALAGTTSVSWDFSTGQTLQLDVPVEAGTIVLGEPAGSECTADVEVRNGTSTHPNNNLIVDLNGGTIITLDDFESVPNTTLVGSAAFVSTGSDELVASIVFTNPARDSSKTSSEGTLTVTCEPPPPGGGEGCTPGYWKQEHHFDSWELTPYETGDSFDAAFGVTSTYDWTMLEALDANGGGENALARHAAAALLNASHPDVSYEYSTAEIIALVQGAYATGEYEAAKDLLEYQNELGCALN